MAWSGAKNCPGKQHGTVMMETIEQERMPGTCFHKFRGCHGRKGGKMGAIFPRFDADKNGVVNKEELTAGFSAMHAETDSDGDGTPSLDEFSVLWNKFRRPYMVDKFQMLDADGSGAVTPEEFSAPFKSAFRRHDVDGNGEVTRDEADF